MSEMPYVVAAYAVTWVVILGYAGYLAARTRQAKRLAGHHSNGG